MVGPPPRCTVRRRPGDTRGGYRYPACHEPRRGHGNATGTYRHPTPGPPSPPSTATPSRCCSASGSLAGRRYSHPSRGGTGRQGGRLGGANERGGTPTPRGGGHGARYRAEGVGGPPVFRYPEEAVVPTHGHSLSPKGHELHLPGVFGRAATNPSRRGRSSAFFAGAYGRRGGGCTADARGGPPSLRSRLPTSVGRDRGPTVARARWGVGSRGMSAGSWRGPSRRRPGGAPWPIRRTRAGVAG